MDDSTRVMRTYEVRVTNTFEANTYRDAAEQMIEWLRDNLDRASYRVQDIAEADDMALDYDASRGW